MRSLLEKQRRTVSPTWGEVRRRLQEGTDIRSGDVPIPYLLGSYEGFGWRCRADEPSTWCDTGVGWGRLTLGCSYPSCSSCGGKLIELNQVLGLQEVEKPLTLLRLRAC